MALTAADVQTEMAMLWCTTFTEADYPRCRQIAFDMVEQALREGLDEPLFAYKSIAQSLHFLGDHAGAGHMAEKVRAQATGLIECTAVHPYISMGIILARIAAIRGEHSEAADIARDVLDRSRRDNPVAICQSLALACLPSAIWAENEGAARGYVIDLIEEAEIDQLNYWRVWGQRVLQAIDLRFNSHTTADGITEIEGVDALLADHLATIDGRAISQLALRRVLNRMVGWSAPEVIRNQAAIAIWYDPLDARRQLDEARRLAVEQNAGTWLARIDETESALAASFRPKDRGSPPRGG